MGRAVKLVRVIPGEIHPPARKARPLASPIDKAKGYELVWANVAPIFEAARKIKGCCFVYVIGEADGPLKIGVSKDPVGRLRTMQTGNPRRLRIEHVLVGDQHLEKLLHELWEPYAIRSAATANKPLAAPGTEWFKAEAREQLAPILQTAAEQQAWRLTKKTDIVDGGEMTRIVRLAHVKHGHVTPVKEKFRVLDNMGGYTAQPRKSRI